MLFEAMQACNNFFVIEDSVKTQSWTIVGGKVEIDGAATGQYYLISGSVFNDGVHRYGSEELTDETFVGTISLMAVPLEFLMLVDNMTAWEEKNAEASLSPYNSESFGGYSYSRATNKNGEAVTVTDAFAQQLRRWRKI